MLNNVEIENEDGLRDWLINKARENRNNPTPSEKRVINWLDKHKIEYVFQKAFICNGKGYIVDFLIKDKYILEVDGDSHNSEEAKIGDEIRTKLLEKGGYKVLRIRNEETVKGLIDTTMDKIFKEIVEYNDMATKEVEINELDIDKCYIAFPFELFKLTDRLVYEKDRSLLWDFIIRYGNTGNKDIMYNLDFQDPSAAFILCDLFASRIDGCIGRKTKNVRYAQSIAKKC